MQKVSHYIAQTQASELKKLSRRMSLSVGALIRMAITEYVNKNKAGAE